MSIRRLWMCAALLACGASAFAQAPKPGSVGFRGKAYDAAALPADVGPAAKAAINEWLPWVKVHGYRMDLDPSRRVLLISTKGNVDPQIALVVKTIAFFDALFPAVVTPTAVVPSVSGVAHTKAGPPGDEIPEDPESPPPGAPATLPAEKDEVASVEHKDTAFHPDSQTAVMFIVKNPADYGSVLDQMCTAYPYLVEWRGVAQTQIGFALEAPLCGAYDETSPGQEEWNPDNELVHRTMALLVLRRFGEIPYWSYVGLCWHAELSLTKSIYCMPYRDGFVGVGEHGGWLATLNSIYDGRAKQPLKPEEFALKRGKWDDKLTKTALGLVDYLVKTNPRALATMLEELRKFRELNGRKVNADGTWTKIIDYEVPGEQQKTLLERYFGANVLRDVIAYWTSGAIAPAK